ncbi:MAG TPA: NAD(P)/FAD-dependent oxidoreductase [Chloroflexota bacterium]|nr:NAD(P)/FAD-dependent oxidoreductase [Chloroflexota bacterium]
MDLTPTDTYDVIVIGGGPGGSTTATVLAQNGHRVLLLEKSEFPRFHVGESLLPALWDIWDRLEVTDTLSSAGFPVKQGVNFNLFNADEDLPFLAGEFPQYFPRPTTFHVDRARYDRILLDNAREHGVEVRLPWTVHEVLFNGPQAIGVRAGPGDDLAQAHTISARVIVDATGRDCLLARRQGWRKPDPKLNKLSYFTHFKGAYRRITDGTVMTEILTLDGGWIWYIPLREDLVSVGAVLDADFVRRIGLKGVQARFDHAIAQSPRVSEWLAGAQQMLPVQTVSNISYLNESFVGDGFVLVGDAAMFVDPIFSAGVTIAMRSGCLAADAIIAALADGDVSADRLRAYEARIRKPMNRIFELIYNWYFILQTKETHNIFRRSLKAPLLRRRLVVIASGGYDVDELDALHAELDVSRAAAKRAAAAAAD